MNQVAAQDAKKKTTTMTVRVQDLAAEIIIAIYVDPIHRHEWEQCFRIPEVCWKDLTINLNQH